MKVRFSLEKKIEKYIHFQCFTLDPDFFQKSPYEPLKTLKHVIEKIG